MSKTIRLSLSALLFLGAPAIALAQPVQPDAQPDVQPDDENGEASPSDLSNWGNNLDRPLARALAFERRDVIEDIIARPETLGAATPMELAREASIPPKHAKIIVEGVAAGGGTGPIHNAETLLRFGLPEGFSPGNMMLAKVSEAALVQAGMTAAEAREFLRYRSSAKRASLHFREVKAIRDARARGAELAAERARAFRGASMADRARMVARGLGLNVAGPTSGGSRAAVDRANVRARLMESTVEATGRDMLSTFRRADGSLDWKKFSSSEIGSGVSGLAHFGMALFLKELAVTLQTGDRGRMEEFVDGLLTTDFFINYGLFSAGARAADVAYGRYVRRLTRKRFLSGVLRSHLVLAAGLAVPMIVRGNFSLDTYLVDVAALGLSATAVKIGVEGLKGAYKLVRGGRTAFNLGRLASPVGWVVSAGETALVLLMGDFLAKKMDAFMSKRELDKRIKLAEDALNAALKGARGRISERDVIKAVDALEEAYDDKRRYTTRGLESRLGEFREEIDGASREALRDDSEVSALEARLANNPNLASHFSERYGSVESFLASMRETRERRVESLLRNESEAFENEFEALTRVAYVGETDEASEENPHPAPATESRLALYDDETSLLLEALDGTTDPEARRHIVLAIERVRLARTMDRAVYESSQPAPETAPSAPVSAASGGLVSGVEGN